MEVIYNWKDTLDKWYMGIHFHVDEMRNLVERMLVECPEHEELFWIIEEFKKRGGTYNPPKPKPF
jgi:hypothetical protein